MKNSFRLKSILSVKILIDFDIFESFLFNFFFVKFLLTNKEANKNSNKNNKHCHERYTKKLIKLKLLTGSVLYLSFSWTKVRMRYTWCHIVILIYLEDYLKFFPIERLFVLLRKLNYFVIIENYLLPSLGSFFHLN